MGKSSERLAEELGAGVLYDMEPVAEFKLGPVQPDSSGVALDLASPTLFNAFFQSTKHHLQVESDGPLSRDPRSWEIYSSTPSGDTSNPANVGQSLGGGNVVLHCKWTDALLTVQTFGPELGQDLRSLFTSAQFEQRMAKYAAEACQANPNYDPAQWRAEFPGNAWALAARIVTDLLNSESESRRSISAHPGRPACLLDLPKFLPALGFTFDDDNQCFRPSKSSSPGYIARLRRLLLELRLETTQFQQRTPAMPAVSKFLGVAERNHLSSPDYACLGCVDSFSDDQICQRYRELAGSPGGPWIFEALMRIAQQRNSETLSMFYMELVSLGTQSITSLRADLADIGLDETTQADLSDAELAEAMLQVEPHNVSRIANALIALRPISTDLQRASALGEVSVSQALRLLSVLDPADEFGDEVVDDVVARFKYMWRTGAPVDRLEARAALLSLAMASRNPRLLELYEGVDHKRLEAHSQVQNLSSALAMLGLSPTTQNHDYADDDLMAIFDACSEGVSVSDLFELRRALKLIATSRGSPSLQHFLGMDEQLEDEVEEEIVDLTGPKLPVGLWNTGNTCYLNSLLQFYYSLLPVRAYVEAYQETVTEPTKEKKIGGRVVPEKEVARSTRFVAQLGSLFREIASTSSAFVTPTELLAYMALVPPQEDANEQIALHAALAGALQRQQDVTECIENVLYQLEATMTGHKSEEDGEQHDLVKDLFYGTTKQTLARVSDGGNARTKTERFSSLLLDVNNGPTPIYDSLDNYFGEELLDIEGDGPTRRTLRISHLPQILQIQVQRVQFDLSTFLPYKNLNPLIFPEIVYLDRYLDAPEGSELSRRNEAAKQWKQHISELQSAQERVAEHKQALDAVSELFSREIVDDLTPATSTAISEVQGSLAAQLDTATRELEQTRTKIEHQFDDMTEHGYQIHSIFIHKGDASYGHYWIYIRDQESGQFFKYNDELVSAVDDAEVFDFREQNPATPYFLVFTKV